MSRVLRVLVPLVVLLPLAGCGGMWCCPEDRPQMPVRVHMDPFEDLAPPPAR